MNQEIQNHWGHLESVGESKVIHKLHKDTTIVGANDILCNIVIKHPNVSNQHCIINYKRYNHSAIITNISEHKLYINNKKLCKESLQIRTGDVINFGQTEEIVENLNLQPAKFTYKFNNN